MTDSDNGKTFQVAVGETLELNLLENATTGYRWAFDSLDKKLIAAAEGDYTAASNAVGSGGAMQWTLKAIAPGTTKIQLKLWRHWEGDASIQKQFAATLVIR